MKKRKKIIAKKILTILWLAFSVGLIVKGIFGIWEFMSEREEITVTFPFETPSPQLRFTEPVLTAIAELDSNNVLKIRNVYGESISLDLKKHFTKNITLDTVVTDSTIWQQMKSFRDSTAVRYTIPPQHFKFYYMPQGDLLGNDPRTSI